MYYIFSVLAACLSFTLGFLIGVFESKRYSFKEVPYWLPFVKKKIWVKRLHLCCIIIERIFIVPLLTLIFLLIAFIFWPKNGYEPFSPYFLFFFAPGLAISTTKTVIKRWRKFKKDFLAYNNSAKN